jgi:hypothetical protein
LAGRVPELQAHDVVVYAQVFGEEVDPHCGLKLIEREYADVGLETVVYEAGYYRGLARGLVAQQDYFYFGFYLAYGTFGHIRVGFRYYSKR